MEARVIKISTALANVRELFLDTAPIIYHVEGNLAYQPLTDQIFQASRRELYRPLHHPSPCPNV